MLLGLVALLERLLVFTIFINLVLRLRLSKQFRLQISYAALRCICLLIHRGLEQYSFSWRIINVGIQAGVDALAEIAFCLLIGFAVTIVDEECSIC